MTKKVIIYLSAIVILAFILRFFNVTKIPPSLNWDEVSIGYNAYSVLKTGRDEWGSFLPLNFRSYGEYKLPAQIYASIPGIAVFGLNDIGVRITPVIYGTLTVLLLFFLARVLFNTTVGLLSAGLLAISPWHIQLTRGSFESSFAVFWVVMGLWFLIRGFKDSKWLIFAMVPFAISVYTYNSARVFTPLFLIIIVVLYWKQYIEVSKKFLIAAACFVLLMLPLVPYYLSGEGNSRYRLVSITDDPGLIPRINETRGNSNLPKPFPRLVYNKVTFISYYTAQNYLSHFSPDFLFISGAPHKQHSVQNMGELYYFQAPFLLLGVYFLLKGKKPYKGLLFSWWLLAFIPVSVTNDSIPHALRTLLAAPVLQIITALGIYESYLFIKEKHGKWKNVFVGVGMIVVLVGLGWYLYNYYVLYPKKYSRDWQYGYKQAADYINAHYSEYDQVVFSRFYGEPHMFTLFYSKFDPASYQNNPNLVRYQAYDWVWVLNFDKYYFPNLSDKGTQFTDLKNQIQGRVLYIGRPEDFPDDTPRLYSVKFLNGDTVFDIVESK